MVQMVILGYDKQLTRISAGKFAGLLRNEMLCKSLMGMDRNLEGQGLLDCKQDSETWFHGFLGSK